MDIETKREAAKLGMVSTLGLTLATAMKMKGKNKKLHVYAGFAFVGFAFWHHMLYPNKGSKKSIKKAPAQKAPIETTSKEPENTIKPRIMNKTKKANA